MGEGCVGVQERVKVEVQGNVWEAVESEQCHNTRWRVSLTSFVENCNAEPFDTTSLVETEEDPMEVLKDIDWLVQVIIGERKFPGGD